MPRGIGHLCLTGGETPEAKPGSTRGPIGGGKLCLVADPTPEAKTAGAGRWEQWIHGLMPNGWGRLCIVADPSPEAKQSGAARWRITPLDNGELGALAP